MVYDNNLTWITKDIMSIEQIRHCPVCNSSSTESKGYKKLSSGRHKKRHCFNCDKYYYVRDNPLQVFYSVI